MQTALPHTGAPTEGRFDDSPSPAIPPRFYFACGVVLAGLYFLNQSNFLLFHAVSELFSVSVAWALLMIVWNARRTIDHEAHVFLGIALAFIGGLDLIHAFAYEGMGVISREWGPEPAHQLWLAARGLQGLSFAAFPLLLGHSFTPRPVLVGYAALAATVLLAVFHWKVFPDCFREGAPTMFVQVSQWCIAALLLWSVLLLIRRRDLLDRQVYSLLIGAVALSMASEMMTILGPGVTDLAFLAGHSLKPVAFYFVYLALVRAGIQRPFSVLFSKLDASVKALRNAEIERTTILDHQPDQILLHDLHNRIVWANKAACEAIGKPREDLIGSYCPQVWNQKDGVCRSCSVSLTLSSGQAEDTIVEAPNGESWHIRTRPILDAGGAIAQVLEIRENITLRMRAVDALSMSEEKFAKAFHCNSNLMCISTVEEGIIEEINTAFLKITGLAREEVIGRSSVALGIVKPADRMKITETLERQGKVEHLNLELMPFSPRPRKCIFSIETITINGRKKLLSMALDITDLVESQRTLKTLIDNLPGIAFRCRIDEGWTMEFISDGCTALTGYAPDDFIENRLVAFRDIILPEDRGPVRERIQKAAERRCAYEIEYRIIPRNGPVRWVCERGVGICSESGDLLALEGFVLDITEWKSTKETLREQTHMLQTILDGIPDPIGLQQTDHSLISYNRAGYELVGKTPEEVRGRKCYALIGRREPCEDCAAARALATGRIASVERFEPVFDRWYQISATPIHGMDGRVTMIVEQMHDISERRRKEAELRRLVSAIHQVLEAVVITDAAGIIEYVNPAFERITGFSSAEAVGRNPRILKSGEHDQSFYRRLWETITAGRTWQGRMTNRKKDGDLISEEVSISPVFDQEGQIVNFVAVKRDITAELKIEEQLRQSQKMEALGALAGGIAHDFNNILFPMVGFAEMLQEDLPSGSPLQEHVREILTASGRAKELVQQILTFSRQAKQEKKALRVQSLIKEVLKLCRASLPSTIKIDARIDNQCRPVLADSTQVHQVAMNLITNAFHAMEETGGTLAIALQEIEITAGSTEKIRLVPGFYVRLSVSDTGRGIDPAIRDKIFIPYFTTKEKYKGTGLGLSVVLGIVQSHGGGIDLDSEPGKGTCMRVYFPCLAEDAPEERRQAQPTLPRGNERILLVDDEEPITRMLRGVLERLGYQVTERTSSIEALQAFSAHPDRFDLVISDMTMPNLTGDRLALEIKRLRPQVPIIICTGYSERFNEQRVRALGIQGYLLKPVVTHELAHKIRDVLDAEPEHLPN